MASSCYKVDSKIHFSEANIYISGSSELQKKKKIVQKVITVEGEFQLVPRHTKKKWIWTETDEEGIQETDEDIQEKFVDVLDEGSSESDYQPGTDMESEDGHVDEHNTGTEIGLGSDGKTPGPKKGYQPSADVESEDALDYVDEQGAGTEIGSGSKKQKQGLAGRKEIQNIRSQIPVENELQNVDRGQKRKAAQNQKHE